MRRRDGPSVAGCRCSPEATSPDRGLFSCPIPQRQPHVVNLDGARPYRCQVQSKIVVTPPPPVFRELHQPILHGIQLIHLAMPSPSKRRTHGHGSAGRGPLASVCCFDQSGEQCGVDATLTCGYKGSLSTPRKSDGNLGWQTQDAGP